MAYTTAPARCRVRVETSVFLTFWDVGAEQSDELKGIDEVVTEAPSVREKPAPTR
ncbi:MAG: hypothetical protein V9G98_04810 [Candidatus Competibacter sp.]